MCMKNSRDTECRDLLMLRGCYSAITLFVVVLLAFSGLAEADTSLLRLEQDEASRIVSGGTEKEWMVEEWTTVNTLGLCEDPTVYRFRSDGTVTIESCRAGEPTETALGWTISAGPRGALVLTLGDTSYDFRIRDTSVVLQMKLRTLYEDRSDVANEIVLFSSPTK